MLPHERDDWNIASSVVVTALCVAGGRAVESTRAPADAVQGRSGDPLAPLAVI